MEIFGDIIDDYWLIGLVILGFIIWADRNTKNKKTSTPSPMRIETMQDNPNINDEKIIVEEKSSVSGALYKNLLSVPVWALYFLILSTVVLTILILTKIWFPEVFVDDFFARILMSYAALMVSTYVIAKMSEAIKEVKK